MFSKKISLRTPLGLLKVGYVQNIDISEVPIIKELLALKLEMIFLRDHYNANICNHYFTNDLKWRDAKMIWAAAQR